jgi:hypothetical protein
MTHPLKDLCAAGIAGYRAAMEEAAGLTQGAHVRALTRPDHAEEILHHLVQRLLDRMAFAETVAARAAREEAMDDQAFRAWSKAVDEVEGLTRPPQPAEDARAEAEQHGLADAVAESLPAPKPAAKPKPATPGLPIWTEEREALLRAEWVPGVDRKALLARINALPGARAIPNLDALRLKTKALDLPAISGILAPVEDPQTGEIGARGKVFTDERLAFMREAYPTMDTMEDVLSGFNALPGPHCISIDSLRVRARLMGLRRPTNSPAAQEARRASMAKALEARWAGRAVTPDPTPTPKPDASAEAKAEQPPPPPADSVAPTPDAPTTFKQDWKVEPVAPAPTGKEPLQVLAPPTLKPDLTVAPDTPRAIPLSDWASRGVLTPAAERDAREQIMAGVGARQLYEDFGGPSLDWWQVMCVRHRKGRAA